MYKSSDIQPILIPSGEPNENLLGEIYQLEGLRTALEDGVAITAWIGLFTLLLVQMGKLILRHQFHWLLLVRWIRQRWQSAEHFGKRSQEQGFPPWFKELSTSDSKAPTVLDAFKEAAAAVDFKDEKTRGAALKKIGRRSFFMKGDYFLKQVQNSAQEALESPSEHMLLLPIVADGASIGDMIIVSQTDWLARNHPSALPWLDWTLDTSRSDSAGPTGEEPTGARVPEALVTAQDNLAAAVERNLDDLQIRLTTWWPMVLRGTSLILGVSIALTAAHQAGIREPTSFLILAAIGLAAGFLAALAYDFLSLIGSWIRPHR